MPISRLYQAFMLDIIIFTHLQRQYSVIEDKNKKVAGDFATFFLTFRTSEQNTYCQQLVSNSRELGLMEKWFCIWKIRQIRKITLI